MPMTSSAGFPLVIELGPDNYCNPIGKVFRRLDEGEEHSLPYFHEVFTTARE